MKKTFYLLLFLCNSVSNAQSLNQQFISPQVSSYNKILHYHYNQSQWYYKEFVEKQYESSEIDYTSKQLNNIILQIKPKHNYDKSILDIYQDLQIKIYKSKTD